MMLPSPFNPWFHLLQERFFVWSLFTQDGSTSVATVLENPGAPTIIIRDLYRQLEFKGPITERSIVTNDFSWCLEHSGILSLLSRPVKIDDRRVNRVKRRDYHRWRFVVQFSKEKCRSPSYQSLREILIMKLHRDAINVTVMKTDSTIRRHQLN